MTISLVNSFALNTGNRIVGRIGVGFDCIIIILLCDSVVLCVWFCVLFACFFTVSFVELGSTHFFDYRALALDEVGMIDCWTQIKLWLPHVAFLFFSILPRSMLASNCIWNFFLSHRKLAQTQLVPLWRQQKTTTMLLKAVQINKINSEDTCTTQTLGWTLGGGAQKSHAMAKHIVLCLWMSDGGSA